METNLDHFISKRCHRNCITSISVFNDKIASGGKDSTVLVHQKSDSQLTCVSKYDLSETNENKCNITSLDYGNELIVASTTLGLVNLIDARSSSKFKAHMKAVSCVKFFADNLIITSGFDNKVRVWDLRSLRLPTQDLIGHTAGVNYLDSLPVDVKDEYLVSFGDGYEKILSCSSDKTVRLWNVNSGTHLVFKIPLEMSQNVECCCLISKRPNYLFAVGLDDNYLLLFSSKLKNYVYKHSFGANVSINCIRHHRGLLIVGTSTGDVCVFRLCGSDDSGYQNGPDSVNYGTKAARNAGKTLNGVDSGLDCELIDKISFTGSVNDIAVRDGVEWLHSGSVPNGPYLTLFVALGTEVRLGRWSTFDSKEAKNQIIIKQIAIK